MFVGVCCAMETITVTVVIFVSIGVAGDVFMIVSAS